jgi:hypothetical protein
MKNVLVLGPVVLSLIILGAHFMRDGNSIGVFGSLALIALLVVRRSWVARLIQAALVLGALEWLHTLYELAQLRVALGLPYTRMVVILGTVAAVTFCSALLFQTRQLKERYRLNGAGQIEEQT